MILKLKQTPAIYLVGFMGCGKSKVGSCLADELGWSFYDLDEEIEKSAGMTIGQYFESKGEEAFRALETETLKKRVQSVKTGRPQVISLGGGTFIRDENFDLAENHGITIWLDTPLEVIEHRIADERAHRPLARDPEKFRALYEARRPLYARADYHLQTADRDAKDIVSEILGLGLFVP
jgi:shikimate kinase